MFISVFKNSFKLTFDLKVEQSIPSSYLFKVDWRHKWDNALHCLSNVSERVPSSVLFPLFFTNSSSFSCFPTSYLFPHLFIFTSSSCSSFPRPLFIYSLFFLSSHPSPPFNLFFLYLNNLLFPLFPFFYHLFPLPSFIFHPFLSQTSILSHFLLCFLIISFFLLAVSCSFLSLLTLYPSFFLPSYFILCHSFLPPHVPSPPPPLCWGDDSYIIISHFILISR